MRAVVPARNDYPLQIASLRCIVALCVCAPIAPTRDQMWGWRVAMGLRKCASWHLRVYQLVRVFQEETVFIAKPKPLGKSVFGR